MATTMNKSSNAPYSWELVESASTTKTFATTLKTAGTMLDRDIDISITAQDGALSATASTALNTTPVVTPEIQGNVTQAPGVTIVQPSGTDGTDYLTIDPSATLTTIGKVDVISNASVSKAGWVDAQTNDASVSLNIKPSIKDGINYYMPVVTPQFTGGSVGTTASNTISINGMTAETTTETPYYIDAVASVTASRASLSYSTTYSGYINKGGVISTTAASNCSATATRIYLPVGGIKFTNGGSITPTAPKFAKATEDASGAPNNVGSLSGVGALANSESNITSATYPYFIELTAQTDAGAGSNVAFTQTEGYITATASSTAGSIALNASAQGKTFIPLKKATGSNEITITNSTGMDYFTPNINRVAGASSKGTSIAVTAQTTEPSGYYIAVQSEAQATATLSVSATATTGASGDGFLGDNTVFSNNTVTKDIALNPSVVTYLPIASSTCTIAGGNLSITGGSATAGITLALDAENLPGTDLTYTTSKPTSGYYITIGGSSTTASGTVQATRAAVTDAHTAGYTPSKTAEEAIAADTKTATFYSNGTTATGYITVPKGVISTGSTNQTTYTQNTSAVVPAEGYLYIGAGYYPDTQISLATMIPDDTNYENAGTDQILKGFEAYDTDGKKLIGTVDTDTLDSTYYTATNTGVGQIAPGFVATASYIIKGEYGSTVNGLNGSTTATVTIKEDGSFFSGSAYGVTTTAPTSGTDGTNYLTINETHESSNGSVKATGKAAVTKSGWIDEGETISSTATLTIIPKVVDNFEDYYIPIVGSTSFSGNKLTTGTNKNEITTNAVVSITHTGAFYSATDYGVTATQPTGTDGTNYLAIDASGVVTTTGVAKSSWLVARATATYSHNAGAITTANGAIAFEATSTTGSATVDITPAISDGFEARYIPIVSDTFSGGALSGSTTLKTTTTATVEYHETGDFFSTGVTSYGVTTTTPTAGTYLTVDATHTVQNGIATSTATYSMAKVTYTHAAGAVTTANGAQALAASGNKYATNTATLSVAVTDSFEPYYIPVVGITLGGAGLTGNSNTITTTTAPKVEYHEAGTFFESTDYGVTTSQPTSGSDGSGYLTVHAGHTVTDGSLSATASFTRAAVTYTNNPGAIAAHTATTGMAADTKYKGGTGTVTPDVDDQFEPYYIPIVGINKGTDGVAAVVKTIGVTKPTFTLNAATGTFVTTGASKYGVTATKPSGTDGTSYLTIDETHSTSAGSVATYAVGSHGNLTYSNAAGAITSHTNQTLFSSTTASSTTATQTVDISVTDNFTARYIPIVSATFDGGAVSGTAKLLEKANVTLSTENTSGVELGISATATRAQITYTNSAGAIEAHAATNAVTATNSSLSSTAYYVTHVALSTSKTFGIQDTIYDWTWNVDAGGNVYVF